MPLPMTTATTARQIGIRQRSLRRHCRLGRATELVFVLATGTVLMLGGQAEAQDWTGALSSNWGDPLNWAPVNVPDMPSDNPTISGPTPFSPTIVLGGNFTVGTTTLSSLQPLLINGSLNTATLNAGTGTTITVNGALTAGGGAGAGNIGGSGGVTKIGPGTLTLSGINTFAGLLDVQAGTVALEGGTAVGDGTTVNIGADGTLRLNNNADPTRVIERIGALNGSGTLNIGTNSTLETDGTGAFSGDLVGGGDALLIKVGAGTLTFSGDGTGFSGLVGSNSGELIVAAGTTLNAAAVGAIGPGIFTTNGTLLSTVEVISDGTVNFNESQTVSRLRNNAGPGPGIGTINIADGAVLTLAGGGTSGHSGVIDGLGGLAVTGGTHTLTGANAYTGATTVSGGTLEVTGGDGAIASAVVTVSGGTLRTDGGALASGATVGVGGTLDVTGTEAFTTLNQTGGTVSAGLGGATIDLSGDFNQSGGTSTTAGTLTVNVAGAFSQSGGATIASGTAVNATGPQTLGGGTIDGNLTGTGAVEVTGNTTLTGIISSDSVTVTAGTLTTDGAGFASVATVEVDGGGLTVNGDESFADLVQTGGTITGAGTTVTLSGDFNQSGGTSTTAGNLTVDVAGNFNQSGGATIALGTDVNATGQQTLGGGIIAGNLTGTGAVNVTGNTTLTGIISSTDITITSGTLSTDGAGLATGSVVANAGTLALTGGGDESIESISGAGGISLSNGSVLTLNAGVSNISGAITGEGGLEVAGTSTTTISGTSNTFSGGTTVTDGQLTLQGAGQNLGGAMTVNGGALVVDGNETLASLNGGGGTVTLQTAATVLTVGDAANANSSYSGTIGGAGALTKAGTGTLTLSGMNTFSGDTTIAAGTLVVTSGSALADTGAVIVGNGGTLTINTNQESIARLVSADTNPATSTAVVNNNAGLVILGATDSTFAGNITGAGQLTNQGGGTLTLTGVNAMTGVVAIGLAGSEIALTDNGSVASSLIAAFLGGTITTDGGGFADTAAALRVEGGTANLSGSETIGSLRGNSVAGFTGTVNLIGTGTVLTLNGSNGLDSGIGDAVLGAGTVAGTGSLNVAGGTTTVAAAGNVQVLTTIGPAGTVVNNGTMADVQNAGTFTNNFNALTGATAGNLTNTLAGAGSNAGTLASLTHSSTGAFANAGIVSGTTTVTSGTLNLNTGTNLSNTALLTVSGGTLNVNEDDVVGALAGTGGTGGTINLDATLTAGGNGATTTYDGAIIGAGTLTKTGAGDLTLSGNSNAFAGTLDVQGGDVVLTGGNAMGNTATVNVGAAGTLQVNTTETIGTLTGAAGAQVALGSGVGLTANVATPGPNVYAGSLSGAANTSFTKTGAGDLTLSGNGSAMLGQVVSNQGGLILATGATLGAGVVGATGTGTFTTAGGGTLGAGVRVISDGTVTFNGSETIARLTNAADTGSGTGTVNINGAGTVLTLAGGGTSGHSGAVNGTGSLAVSGGSHSLTGNIDLDGSITVDDAGTLVLAGNNTIDGGIFVQGTLRLESDNAAGGAGGLITTLGTVIDYANGTNNVTGISVESDDTQLQVSTGTATQTGVIADGPLPAPPARPIEKIGDGRLILAGDNTYTGDTTVTGGVLEITGAIDSAAAIVNAGATLETNSALAGGALVDTATVTLNDDGALVVTADETIGALNGGTDSTATLTGNLTLTTGTSAMAGIIDGGGELIVDGGTVTLTNANIYTGPTTVTTGLLNVGTAGDDGSITSDVTVAAGGNLAVAVDGTVTGNVVTEGAASSNAGEITGTLTVDAGGFENTGSVGGATTVTNGTLDLNGATDLSNTALLTVNGGTVNVGAGVDEVVGALDGTGGTIVLTGNLEAGGNGDSTTYAGVIDGAGGLTKAGGGTLELSGDSTHTGALTVTGGVLEITGAIDSPTATVNAGATLETNSALAGGALVDTATVTLNGTGNLTVTTDETIGALNGGTDSTATLTGNLTLTTGTSAMAGIIDGGGELIVDGGTVTLTNANTYTGATTVTTGLLNVGTTGDDGSITSDVTVAAGGNLAVAVDGTVTGNVVTEGAASSNAGEITGTLTVDAGGFENTGSVGGDTTVNDGVLTLGTGSDLANGGVLAVNDPGRVDVNANVLETVGALTGTGAGAVIDLGTGSGLTFGGARTPGDPDDTYAGAVNGTGTLTKAGGGTQVMTGTSLHTGTLNVDAGTLFYQGAGSTDSAIVNVRNAATLRTDGGALDGAADVFVMDMATLDVGAGSESFELLTQTGGTVTGTGGTITLTGAFDQSGATSTTAGSLTINAGSFTQSGGATIADGTVINSSGPQTLNGGTIAGDLIGGGAVTVQTGTTTLDTTGLIAANTTIDSRLDMSGTLGGTAANNGTLNVTAGTITGAATNDGTLTIASGNFTGGLTNNSTTNAAGAMTGNVTNFGDFAATGDLTAGGGALDNRMAGNVTVSGVDYTGLASVSNSGTIDLTGGTLGATGSIGNFATVNLTGGTLAGNVNNVDLINVNSSSTIAGSLGGGGMVNLTTAAASDTLALGGAGTTVGAQTFDFRINPNATGAHVVSQAGTTWDGTAKNFVVDLSAGDMALGAEAVLVGGQTGINEVLFGAPIGGFIAYEVVDSSGDTRLRAVTNPGVGAIPSGVSLTQSLISNVVNRPSSPFASGLAAEQGCSQGGYFRGVMGRANASGTSTNGTSTSVNTLNARYGGVQGGWDVICNDGRFLGGWDGGVGAIVGYNFGKSDQPVTQLNGGVPVTTSTTHTDFRQSYLGFYMVGSRDRLTLDAQVRFEDTKYTLNETVNIGAGLGLSDSEFSTRGFNFTGRASYRLDLNDDGLSFVPTAGFSLTRTNATELRFTTGNTLALDAYTSKVGFVGGTLAKSTINEAGDAGSTVFGSLNYYREFGGDRTATANDVASGTSMSIASAPIEGFGEASVGWNYVKILEDGPGGAKQLNANIRADARFGGSLSNSYSLTAQVRLSF